MKKEIKIYFGKQSEGILGFSTPDTLVMSFDDDFDETLLIEKHWALVKSADGKKTYINTENILWFECIEKEDKDDRITD